MTTRYSRVFVLPILALLTLCATGSASAFSNSTVVKGSHGESLSAIPTTVAAGGLVKITGAHFDETVGIYLAFCVLPKKGAVPTPCGGGINKAGLGQASYWISSNPPPYGAGLAEGYAPGGRFSKTLRISSMIGKYDCRKIRCAITVRADHTREGDRTYDMFIPIKFSAETHSQRISK